MKKILSHPIIKTIGRFADSAILGGAVKNFKNEGIDHPKGSMDVPALIGSLAIPVLIIILYATGIITMGEAEQLKEIVE